VLKRLRARLGSSAQDRRRAISVMRTLGLTARFAEELALLARDADPTVRSAAVAVLGTLQTPAARRTTRDALDDPDHRVQANAIESLTREQVAGQTPLLTRKLSHRDNRVRANAVRRLLQLKLPEAARALLEMLGDGNRAHRTSALWVVERMKLTTALDRIEAIARDDPDERVRARARRLLHRVGNAGNARPAVAVVTEVAT
jgi:HEAT repeat protein